MSETMSAISIYLSDIRNNLARGNATEHTHRPALKVLLETFGKGITATNEPKRILCGSPDFQITRKSIPLGHVETKDIGMNLDEMERGKGPHGEQFSRYRDALPNWILTDYVQFRWFVNGEKRLAVCIAEPDAKGKLKLLPDGEKELEQLLTAFLKQEVLTIGTAKDLAQRMAGMTRIIRDLMVNTFNHEKEQGFLHNWLAAFRETLIPDLDERQFADMFAQTLAYGLFAARVHTPANKEFSREMAAYNLPKTNPFLRKLFAEIAGVDMPDSIAWAVDDIVELLRHADMSEILKDFGKGKGKEDPVVHFYETFLAAYDPKMREVRGVYYTPEPVVSYIVRSIDYLLKTGFNRPKGLADENTLILDPATGTATFLYFVIDQIHQKFAKQAGAWDDYVARHLLNRIFGFELLMAPYAVAHLKLGMQLQQTGYQFGSDQRLGIYLTNTLEEAAKKSEQLFAAWVADEANAAAKIKRDDPILVVLGNPPYSAASVNKGAWITKLVRQTYYPRDEMKEKNPKLLLDDYVKFIRFAHWRIERTGEGIVGFITNHGYLDNPTFRGMRQSLIQSYNEIYVYNLHGSIRRKEKSPDGEEDTNVFDIQQGVAILLCIKYQHNKQPARVYHADLWGKRQVKYEVLRETDASCTHWTELHPSPRFFLFTPQDTGLLPEYEEGWRTTEIFPVNSSGLNTLHDGFVISFDREPLLEMLRDALDNTISNEQFREKYGVSDSRDWKLADCRKRIANNDINFFANKTVQCLYRPFDKRWIILDNAFVTYPRWETTSHFLSPDSLGFAMNRQTFGTISLLASKLPLGQHKIVDPYDRSYIFPLYLYPLNEGELRLHEERHPNFSPVFLSALAERLKLPQEGPNAFPNGITAEDIFRYAYAVFHSPTYRTRYTEFLRIDFPRLPLTSNMDLFQGLAAKGAELIELHLMEAPKLEEFLTDWPVKGDNAVEKVQHTDKDGRVWINRTQYFGGVPKEVWEFHIGGYQVCDKWLKDRKGRHLSYDDIMHYQKIIVALNETIRLMHEIDEIINKHGGWPRAFQASSVKSTSEPGAKDTQGLARAAENGPAYGKKKK